MTENNHQNIISEVKDFMYENGPKYLKLLREVRLFLSKLQSDLSENKIYRIYSRKENLHDRDEFKTPDRTALKLARWRRDVDPDTEPRDIHDIVAVSVVVFYDSDIDDIFSLIKRKCVRHHLSIHPYLSGEESSHYKENGYHARHLVLTSSHPTLIGLKCEIQIKTLLHDAWHAKTHDLTYKPSGDLRDEHRRIMESFGESIQALEVQSEMVRTMMTEDWIEEEEMRHTARVAIFDWLEEREFKSEAVSSSYKRILATIHGARERLKRCSIVDDFLRRIVQDIRDLRNLDGGLEAAWPLMVYVSGVRADNNLNYIAKEYVRDWLRQEKSPALATLFRSFAYHMIGERSERSRRLKPFFSSRILMMPNTRSFASICSII